MKVRVDITQPVLEARADADVGYGTESLLALVSREANEGNVYAR